MKAQVLTFHCVLKNKLGQVLGVSFNQGVLTSVQDRGESLIGLAKVLEDIKEGEKRRIFVPADQAYGFYDLKKVFKVSIEEFSKIPQVGQKISIESESSNYRVTDVSQTHVTLDGNHPLAGQDLIFEVDVTQARPATQDEISSPVSKTMSETVFH